MRETGNPEGLSGHPENKCENSMRKLDGVINDQHNNNNKKKLTREQKLCARIKISVILYKIEIKHSRQKVEF